ncbi:hypothetical protein N7478_010120 [Penicillium angulare]|uniref:uncharacterized protein n=1 Tax=Penicillium angulare TaxID=116970 RepID=UPI002542018B|nr:uncharacterized protein N7478_010120 [Penicillium angulare]KAJ5267312.1 hypothetical protein N7478_010120 [Penicillium angulare]
MELTLDRKDAFMETHRLHRKGFRPILRDEGHRIIILVPRPSPDEQSSEALGFIKYQKSNGSTYHFGQFQFVSADRGTGTGMVFQEWA